MVENSRGEHYNLLCDKSDEELLTLRDDSNTNIILHLLYDRYEKRIYFKAKSLLKDAHEAKDLSHEIFIKIFTRLDQFKGNSKFSLWVHSISVNTCITYIQKRKRLNFFQLDSIDNDIISDSGKEELDLVLLKELQINQLDQLIGNLKEEDRLLLIMKYADGLKIEELAEITSLGQSAIKMRLKRIKQKVNELYQSEYST